MAVNGVSQQLSRMPDEYTLLRTGVVTGNVDPFGATVEVGGTAFRAAYLRAAPPVAGDVVTVLRQAASWFILGTASASGDNLIQNPSFEILDEVTSFPTGWTLTNLTATSSASVVSSSEAVDGANVLEVVPSTAVTAVSYVYSNAIAVVPGQVYRTTAYAGGFYPSHPVQNSEARLVGLWFANSTDLYPTISAANSAIVTRLNVPEDEFMTLLTGTVTVPVGAVFMRLALRSTVEQGAGLHWDFATARLV